MSNNNTNKSWKQKLHEIIYEADTPKGKWFDIILLWAIILSIVFVMLESVETIDQAYHTQLNIAEWVITILFTIEYIARIIAVKKPLKYILSFYGIIDFLAILPKYLSIIIVGSQVMVALRALRLLRIFRILKLARYIGESNMLLKALRISRRKIAVFLFVVVIICIIMGTVMYLIEGGKNSGFTSIPRSIYWCIVTLTTVGYGDIAPVTVLGQLIASFIMIIGYGIIAVPTGIVAAEYNRQMPAVHTNTQACPNCGAEGHKDHAEFCYKCGHHINEG